MTAPSSPISSVRFSSSNEIQAYLQKHDKTKDVPLKCIQKIASAFENSIVPRAEIYERTKGTLEQVHDSPTGRTASKVSAALLEYSRKGRTFTDPGPRARECVIL